MLFFGKSTPLIQREPVLVYKIGFILSFFLNLFIGKYAGNFAMGSDANKTYQSSNNVAIGENSLYHNTRGYDNTAIGVNSLFHNTIGYNNTANGLNSLYYNTTGYYNTATGLNALYTNTTGHHNISLGLDSGRYIADGTANETGNYNMFLGTSSRALADGDTNEIVIGSNAVGEGSNSVVLGNNYITKTILKGVVNITQIKLTPTFSAPSSPQEGDIYMDSSDHKLKVYDGSTWQSCW
jgi:hypothetical protein